MPPDKDDDRCKKKVKIRDEEVAANMSIEVEDQPGESMEIGEGDSGTVAGGFKASMSFRDTLTGNRNKDVDHDAFRQKRVKQRNLKFLIAI